MTALSVARKKAHFYQDMILIGLSVMLAVYIVKTNIAPHLVLALGGMQWVGVVIAGMFFTSAFTTAPAIAVLGELALTTPLPMLFLLGAIGATLGDYIIFRFFKNRISQDLEYVFSLSKKSRFSGVFKTHLFKFFVPFIGALIIASPMPDEVGVAMLGISKVKDNLFLAISFVMNGVGIFIIGFVARYVIA